MSLPNFHTSSYYTFPFSVRISSAYLLNSYGQSPESLDRYYYYYRTRRNTVNVTTHNNTFVRIFITYYTSTDRKCYTYYIIMTTRIRLFFIRFFTIKRARFSYKLPVLEDARRGPTYIYDCAWYNNIIM